MIITSPEELIHLWEQILTGTYDSSTAVSTAAPAETSSESFETVLEEESAVESTTVETSEDVSTAQGPTKSEILATGRTILGAAVALWQSLDETVQEQMRIQASAVAQQAAVRAKSYWNALSPEAQAEAQAKAQKAVDNALEFWQSLPA